MRRGCCSHTNTSLAKGIFIENINSLSAHSLCKGDGDGEEEEAGKGRESKERDGLID